MTRRTSTSKGSRARIIRAINQLENVRALLSGMPKKVWKTKHNELTELIQDIDQITDKTRTELAPKPAKKNQ